MRAGRLVCRRGRATYKDASPAFRIAHTRHIEWARDVDPGNGRRALHLRQLGDRLQLRVGFSERALHEGNADPMGSGLHFHPDPIEPRLHLVRGDGLVLVDRLQVRRAPEGVFEHPCVVDGQNDMVRVIDLGDIAGAAEKEVADAEFVLAIGGKIMITSMPPRVPSGSPSMCRLSCPR